MDTPRGPRREESQCLLEGTREHLEEAERLLEEAERLVARARHHRYRADQLLQEAEVAAKRRGW